MIQHVAFSGQQKCDSKSNDDEVLCVKGVKNGVIVRIADFGGPLVSNGRLIGIASQSACVLKDVSGMFTRVSHFSEWIESNSCL